MIHNHTGKPPELDSRAERIFWNGCGWPLFPECLPSDIEYYMYVGSTARPTSCGVYPRPCHTRVPNSLR
jgi:hypothetical protein